MSCRLPAAPHKKGKYAPLAILAQRMGALALLEMDPALLRNLVCAMQEATVCAAAAMLLEAIVQVGHHHAAACTG